jgi:hypothetical protein
MDRAINPVCTRAAEQSVSAAVEADTMDEVRQISALAFEYFMCQNRIIPVPSPRLHVTPDGELEVVLHETEDEIWVHRGGIKNGEDSLKETLDDYESGKVQSYAYFVKNPTGEWNAIITFAPTKWQAEQDADLWLASLFVDEVGEGRATRLLAAWMRWGPGFLIATRPTAPCPCGSGRKHRKCCGRGKLKL